MSKLISVRMATLLFIFTACRGTEPTSPSPSASSGGGDAGAALTEAQCKAQGGELAYDIGDGAIHRPDYRCPKSGKAPLGAVTTEPGKPIPVEGAVCCL